MNNEEIIKNITNFLNGMMINTKYHYESGEAVNNYIERFMFYPSYGKFSQLEINLDESKQEPIKVNLINNIVYDLKGVDIDGDVSIMRIFTVENKQGTRYFSSSGSDYVFGYPTEHNKDDFIKLLENHNDLKNSELKKCLANTILHSELSEDLSVQETKNKKPKL